MYATHVTFNLDGLSEQDYIEMTKSLAPSYAAVPGLKVKIWIKQSDNGVYGGIYLWESKAAYQNYMESELYKSVSSHPNLVNLNTECYDDIPEGTSATKGPCDF